LLRVRLGQQAFLDLLALDGGDGALPDERFGQGHLLSLLRALSLELPRLGDLLGPRHANLQQMAREGFVRDAFGHADSLDLKAPILQGGGWNEECKIQNEKCKMRAVT